MAGKTFKTEAVILRSMRYGEADRILQLYSPSEGRLGAIAKGVRKPRSRFGGRLEPYFRLDLVLHRGRGDLATVSSAETIDGFPKLRSSAGGLRAAEDAGDAVLRLFDSTEPNLPAYNLLCRYLQLIDAGVAEPEPRGSDRASSLALAFRVKLALAAGFAPELAACARCGDVDTVAGFSGSAGGVVCAACESDSDTFGPQAHEFLVQALAAPLSAAPAASEPALRQAERAISAVLEHHAHVRLRPAA